jgi:pullulanase
MQLNALSHHRPRPLRFIRSGLTLAALALTFSSAMAQNPDSLYNSYPVYSGKDLGLRYSPAQTSFRVWAPGASEVTLRLYRDGSSEPALRLVPLEKSEGGSWQATVAGDLRNLYYTFQVKQNGKWLAESADLYATAVGVNGKRGMIVDLRDTDPPGWAKDRGPRVKRPTDIVLWETHVRDLSISANSGMKHKGKFLAFAEKGTKGPEGVSTGLDHLQELGITHVHLLPSFDFNSIDESKLNENRYNWGYDPLHYNVPEGSFSTDPHDGRVRIREFKQLVQALHGRGIGVIMDVVYNHTSGLQTPFNLFAPGYFYRHRPDGSYSDASACGNETASERAMMRKYMIESIEYWMKEYHIDGFRFDLMGIHDIETMNAISEAARRINPSVFLYGEGWTAGASPLPESIRAVKKNTLQLKNIAAFSDDLRDALRGPYSNAKEKGFVSGKEGLAESIKFGIVASTLHPQVNYSRVNYSKAPWAREPHQTISYVSCHDDPTLFDRLAEANEGADEAALIRMDKLAQTIVMTSQGVAFLHAGAELLRTKQGVHNSYNSPDSINEMDWSRKARYKDVFEYYKGLVALRRQHPAFRLPTAAAIRKHLSFIDTADSLLVAYRITGAPGDSGKDILVLLNGRAEKRSFTLPAGNWQVAGNGEQISLKGITTVSGQLDLPPTTATILFRR